MGESRREQLNIQAKDRIGQMSSSSRNDRSNSRRRGLQIGRCAFPPPVRTFLRTRIPKKQMSVWESLIGRPADEESQLGRRRRLSAIPFL